MRLSAILSSCAPLLLTVWADVKFKSPTPGSTQSVGTLTVEWTDSGDAPRLKDLSGYTLQLMVGGNEEGNSLPLTALVAKGDFATGGNKAQGTVQATLAGPTKNGYYLKMISTAKDGGTITNFSGRFSISGMTGTTPPTYEAAAKAVTGTDGPAAIDAIANNVAGAAPAAAAGPADQAAFAVPYAMQTGLTKYAPMQSTPPTKISVKNFSPLHPTSAFTIATTWMKKPTVVTTFTQSQTHSVSSRENPAPAQALPTDDMQKFLARWKD